MIIKACIAVLFALTLTPGAQAQTPPKPNIIVIFADAGPGIRNEVFYYWDSELRAVRKGKYKAHFVTSGAYGEGQPRTEHNPPLLFDLSLDPGERFNIAADHPDVVADLVQAAKAHREAIVAGWPLFDELLPRPQGQ